MKRNAPIYWIIGAVCLLCAGVLLRKAVFPELNKAGSGGDSASVSAKKEGTAAEKNVSGAPYQAPDRGKVLAELKSAYSTPIKFYGKVVDQAGIPVQGANVHLSVNDKPFGGGPSEYTRLTDRNGFFTIDAAGLTMGVEVSKVGYREVSAKDGGQSSRRMFEFGLGGETFRSGPEKPAVFLLYKVPDPETLIKTGPASFYFGTDGAPLQVGLDEKNASHGIVLRFWSSQLRGVDSPARYDWRLEISVPKGGIVAKDKEFEQEAPEKGYSASVALNMPASNGASWSDVVKRGYFIRFDDGVFARVTLTMHATEKRFVTVEGYVNPRQEARNLESKKK